MDNEAVFILTFDKYSLSGCRDTEIRICRAYNMNDAIKIAKQHRDRYLKGWSYSVASIVWEQDNTAHIYLSLY